MHILVGCVVAVISSATQSIGLTLQRKSHLVEQTSDNAASSLPLWRLGVVLFIVANLLGSSVQIVALPLIVLCPLQAVGLVFNSIFASLLLGEPFSRMSLLGTALVVLGAALIAGFGIVPEPEQSLDELLAQFSRFSFQFWMVVTLMAGVAVFFAARKSSTTPSQRGVLNGVLSGILSAHSLLMAKSAVELLMQAFKHGFKDLLRYQFWLIVGSFVAFAVSQLYFVNVGLRYCSTSILYPLVFCVFNVVSMVNGLVYFDQKDVMNKTKLLAVMVGTTVLLSGVLLLSLRLDSGPETQSEGTPLLNGSEYTSLDTLNPSISNPDARRPPKTRNPATYHARGARGVRRTISKEQAEILSELGESRR